MIDGRREKVNSADKYRLRLGLGGGTVREKNIHTSRAMFESSFRDDPSYKEGVEILGKGHINLRMSNYRLIQNTTPQMSIQASPAEEIMFTLGDVFRYNDGYWLCVESNDEHGIYRRGKVEECNYLLKWQNPKTYELISRWCSVRDPYASGVDEAKVVTTGNARYRIKLPHDGETAQFHVDKRFLIDIADGEPIPYAIVKYDAVTNRYAARDEGFLVITLKESQRESDDSRELMIANYMGSAVQPPAPAGSCTIVGSPKLKCGGSARRYTAKFYDNGGNELDAVTPTWELLLPASLTRHHIDVICESEDGIELKAAAAAAIGSVFTLKATADDAVYGRFEAAVEIEVEELY